MMENSNDTLLYWNSYLKGYQDIAEVPFKLNQPARDSYEEGLETFELTGEVFTAMLGLCNRIKVTPDVFIQGVWGFLLAKYNNTQDVIFGYGKFAETLHAVKGDFQPIIPLRIRFNSGETITEFLKKIEQEIVPDHYCRNLDLLAIQSQNEAGLNLINNVLLVKPYSELLNKGNDLSHAIREGRGSNQLHDYDFKIAGMFLPSALQIDIKYNKNIYNELLIKGIMCHFSNLADQFSHDENRQLKNVNFLSDSERQTILHGFNDTAAGIPEEETILDFFTQQVIKNPDHVAVVNDNDSLTYHELDRISNQLAHYLFHQFGIIDTDVVGVKLKRSEFMIISIFGILKAGAIYLPIDNNMQEKRIEYIQQDSQYKLLIDEKFIRDFLKNKGNDYQESIARKKNAAEVAYIIYTSGTTGLPKGTMIEHHSLVNRLNWMQKHYNLSADDTILQKTTSSFDVSVWELLWWSIAGSKVFFLKDGEEKDPEKMIECIFRHSISVIHFVPSMLLQFLNFVEDNKEAIGKLSSLKQVYSSGEALTGSINFQFHNLFENVRLTNLYGPTEATIDVTFFDCKKGLTTVPIGKPIDNTRIYILDNNLDILPVGANGRMFLAGAGLARGYLNRAELTAQRFLNDPFFPGERMYDTGDISKWMADGSIEYIGRNDDQVKIRGFRVELGEINYHLEKLKHINAAHVLKLEEKLVAFLLFKEPDTTDLNAEGLASIRAELAKYLPDYMIPHHFIQIKEVPLSLNGKIDKKVLISLFDRDKDTIRFAPPAQELSVNSKNMALIWAEVLKLPIENIDATRSFIEHGGDSLSMLRVVAMCKKKGYAIHIKEFLSSPYVNFLDNISTARNKSKKADSVLSVDTQLDPFILSPIQQFFFDHNKQGLKFIMHASYYINQDFSFEAVNRSIADLTDDHDSLRLRFRRGKAGWHQQYDFDTAAYVLEESGPVGKETGLNHSLARAMKLIDIEKGPLVYANIFFENNKPVLFLACHHLVMDAVSWKIFISDLQINYTNNMLAIPAGLS